MISQEYRGLITDRALTKPSTDGLWQDGILVELGLPLNNLVGKKVLEVCCGGGGAVKEARALGINYVGIDILPILKEISLESPLVANTPVDKRTEQTTHVNNNINEKKKELIDMAQTNAVIAGDATLTLPFAENAFDIVLSCLGLPDYATDSKGAITSILEMIRIAKEKVVISAGWNETNNPRGIIPIGVQPNDFSFRMKDLLDELKTYGIAYTLVKDEKMPTPSVHIDVSAKDIKKISDNEKKFYMEQY